MPRRLYGVAFRTLAVLTLLIAALAILAGLGSRSVSSCDDFLYLDARDPDVSAKVAQQRAQEWADGLSSSFLCKLHQAQAINGFGKAQFYEPAPIVAPALAVASASLFVVAAALGRLAWKRRR